MGEAVNCTAAILLVAVNALAFFMCLHDKLRAIKGGRRVPERALLGISAAFGSVGMLAGMLIFRHKTKKMRFALGVPVMLVFQVTILYFFVLWGKG